MKKVLVIDGSYRESGDTAYLIDRFLEGCREADPEARIEVVRLREAKIEYCRGCWGCGNPENIRLPIGSCPIEDDVRPLLEKSRNCDILIYATPVYEMGPTALMKKFLERNLPVVGPFRFGFTGRQPPKRGKAGVVILSSGAPYPLNVLLGFIRYPKRILSLFCRFHGSAKIAVLPAGGVGGSDRMRLSWGRKAARLGKRLAAG
jgi:multimeric flavodoxin WrbA